MRDLTMTADRAADLARAGAESVVVNTTSGLRLHILDYGGTGPVVLCLPGITTPAICFDFVAQALRDDYRVLTLDIRGRGSSDAGSSWTLEDYVDDVESVVRGLGLRQPLLLGHSMGARIASAAAARDSSAYLGAVIVDPPLTGPGRNPYPTPLAVFEAQLQEAYAGTTTEAVAQWWPRWPRREQELRARWLASCDLQAIRGSYESFDDVNFLDAWSKMSTPAVLMYGLESLVVTDEGLADCRRANPSATYVGVAGAGHMVFWDNYADGTAQLMSALGRLID